MPPAKTARTAKKKTVPAARKAVQRSRVGMSATHKQALADGRTMSATVDRYLAAVNTPKRRGRKVSKTTVTERLAAAQVRLKTTAGVEKVLAAQETRDLQAKLAQMNAGEGGDQKTLEAAFVKIAKTFSENRGIGYAAWRDAGVSAGVLKRAGIARTRG